MQADADGEEVGDRRQKIMKQIERVVKEVFETYLWDVKVYESKKMTRLTSELCDAVQKRARLCALPYYRLVTQVVIGQDTGVGAQVMGRCRWNPDTDIVVSVSYRNRSVYAVGMIYGVCMLYPGQRLHRTASTRLPTDTS